VYMLVLDRIKQLLEIVAYISLLLQ